MVNFIYNCSKKNKSDSPLVESFSRLIKFLGNDKAQKDNITINIILQHDLFDKQYQPSRDDNDSLKEWDLDMMSAVSERDKKDTIDKFKTEPKKNKRTVLIVYVDTSTPKVWTIAMFNDEGELVYKDLENDGNYELATELNNEERDTNKIINLTTSYLGLTCLKYPRHFLEAETKLEKNDRFIFVHIDDGPYYQKFDFWRKILGNVGFGDVVNPINPGKIIGLKDGDIKREHNIASYIVSSIEELCNETNLKFANMILNKLRLLNDKFKNEKECRIYYNSIIEEKKINIDEIGSHEKLSHGNPEEKKKKKDLLFYSHLREALLDWSKQNDWVFINQNKFEGDFQLLILDDLMWGKNWPIKGTREDNLKDDLLKCLIIANEFTGRQWNVYSLGTPAGNDTNFKNHVKMILNKEYNGRLFKPVSIVDKSPLTLKFFTHILVDWMLDESCDYSGLNLVRELKSWIDRNKKKLNIIPEILILSRSDDPVTIQSALNAGASGYIIKDHATELPLIVGRAGMPLKVYQAEEINLLISESFPSLMSFPAFVPKSLYFDRWKKNRKIDPPSSKKKVVNLDQYDSPLIVSNHRKWLNEVPKADLHVHFGTSIPLDVCYDLAIISVYRWYRQFSKNECGDNTTKLEQPGTDEKSNPLKKNTKLGQLARCAKLINDIITKTIKKLKEKEEDFNESDFRDFYIASFKEITNIYEVATVNNTIKRLDKRFDKLTEEMIACLIVTGLGILFGKYANNKLEDNIGKITELSETILNSSDTKNPLLAFYLQDSKKIIEHIMSIYKGNNTIGKEICDMIPGLFKLKINNNGLVSLNFIDDKLFEPLSSLLSIPNTLQNDAQGLNKYLGAGDLVGASLLQFVETLLLASYHIPIWASKQKIMHQELRAGPIGYLKELDNPNISTKIMMLGLFAGIQNVPNEQLTTSVLITAKRHKEKADIKRSALLATEFITKNEEDKNSPNSHNFIPKVLGMDLAGIERGNLPDDLVEQFKETFRRCLLMTIHAGEDESVESVWQAVYSLHALRVGHGLRLDEHPDLKRLFKDRQLCVELCPKSNQYTNGYAIFAAEKTKGSYYVFEDYWKYGIPLTINTDNPLLSYRANNTEMPYPLCEEYLALPHLLGTNSNAIKEHGNKRISINRLLILKLIYNGLKHSFLDPKEKVRLIENADREVFNVLAKEFLDVYISSGR